MVETQKAPPTSFLVRVSATKLPPLDAIVAKSASFHLLPKPSRVIQETDKGYQKPFLPASTSQKKKQTCAIFSMDSQLTQTNVHPNYDRDPHDVGLHQVEEGGCGEDHSHQPEKKSVLKKVKDKTKKIKDTLTKHGPCHEHSSDEEEEEDEEDENVQDPNLPGRSSSHGNEEENRRQPCAEVSQDKSEIKEDSKGLESNTKPPFSPGVVHRPAGGDRTSGSDTGQEANPRKPMGGLEDSVEDPHAPNTKSEVADPSGACREEAGITPILHTLGKLNVSEKEEEIKPESEEESTQTADQFSDFPARPGCHDQFSSEPGSQSFPEKMVVTNSEDKNSEKGSYTEKISTATSAIRDKAISAKNQITSKLMTGGENSNLSATSPVEYGKKIAVSVTEKLSPLYQKVTEAKVNVLSKIRRTDSASGSVSESTGEDGGVSAKSSFAEKLKPGEGDKALSEVILEALQGKLVLQRPAGEVTESEEGKGRLGAEKGDEEVKGEIKGDGKGMVGKIKEAVGSLIRTEKPPASQQSSGCSTQGDEGFSGGAGGDVGQRGQAEAATTETDRVPEESRG